MNAPGAGNTAVRKTENIPVLWESREHTECSISLMSMSLGSEVQGLRVMGNIEAF